ncbi:hypothetical protein EUTSA_v10014839mg [Eutrema salsugineum]|uniref:RRM domain-containing protein n=1 Tax=Eutrema salsugineum TaxID=72664 RepID=V4N516_EUTSA|nr:eukaryotic translation initiation factor 3 subunit G [Eutrema salsugineum]ESQ40516.1 hypothetical protein EUTSA_v10014839mg [Eutrema salsugineum]
MRSTEDNHLERIRAPGSIAEEAMVCRLCDMRRDHWTSRCPQKDLLSLMETPLTAEASTSTAAEKAAYVPPSRRPGAKICFTNSDRRRRNDENTVRVTNLSEYAREPDLMELFCPFGAVRAYVAIDQKTTMSKGFGFVSFASREDAQRAINGLNGFGYDNLILRVEWAAPFL